MFPFLVILVADTITAAGEIQFAEDDQHDILVVELPGDVIRHDATECC